MADGARVGRYVLDRLQEIDLEIQRPKKKHLDGRPRAAGRGQQQDLHELYVTITTLKKNASFKRMLDPDSRPGNGDPVPPSTVHE